MAISAREAALKTLGAYRKNGAWSDTFLNNLIKKESLPQRDAALASRLCYGVLQNKLLCDYYISCYSAIRINKIEPVVLDLLELSVYQLLFMDRIPASAAVHEGVELVKKLANPRAAGFVNAVLRKLGDNLDSLPEISASTPEERLSIKYSHPLALVKRLGEFLRLDELEKLLAANNEETPISAQVNTLKTDAESVMSKLRAEGAEVKSHPWLGDCVLISGGGSPESSEVFRAGGYTVQDAAARLAIMAAGPAEGQAVLDACSAPGGKVFMSAIMMGNKGSILAADLHEKKLLRIKSGAERLGISIIETAAMDAARHRSELDSRFDLVIADVPCSGLGIIRKKPEIRYKSLDDLKGLPEIQLRILENVSNYLRPGGVLLYSTCTILPDENERVVSDFASKHREFVPEPFALPGPVGRTDCGFVTLYPHVHGTDGFFICKMRRK